MVEADKRSQRGLCARLLGDQLTGASEVVKSESVVCGAARPQTVKAVPRGQKLILFEKKQRGVAPAARGRRVSLLPAESEGVEKNGFSQKMVFRKIRG